MLLKAPWPAMSGLIGALKTAVFLKNAEKNSILEIRPMRSVKNNANSAIDIYHF